MKHFLGTYATINRVKLDKQDKIQTRNRSLKYWDVMKTRLEADIQVVSLQIS